MWLLTPPLDRDEKVALPRGRYGIPPHYDAIELGRQVQFFASVLQGIDQHIILAQSAAEVFLSRSPPPNLKTTLLVIAFNEAPISNTLSQLLDTCGCDVVLLQFPTHEDINYSWQERYLKRALIDLIRERIYVPKHVLAPLEIRNLAVLDAAGLTTEALEFVDLLEGSMMHRWERIQSKQDQGTTVEDYRSSLHHIAGRRFVDRLIRLRLREREAALHVIRNDGRGQWNDDEFRLGAEALQRIGLAHVNHGSVILGPLARQINEPWIGPILRELDAQPQRNVRRWVLEARPILHQIRERQQRLGRIVIDEIDETPPPLDTMECVEGWVKKGQDFQDRCERARDFLSDPDRKNLVQTNEHLEYGLWEQPIRQEFTTDEWDALQRLYSADELFDEGISDAEKQQHAGPHPQSTFRGFEVIDRKRFRTNDVFFRKADAFLDKSPERLVDLARWVSFALFDGKFVGSYDRKDFANFLSWSWRTILDKPIDEPGLVEEGIRTVRRCMALALKYQFPEHAHFEDDVRSLRLDPDSIMPHGDRTDAYVELMRVAFGKMLDDAFGEAKRLYEQAGAEARYSANPFREWAALQGEKDAAFRLAISNDPDFEHDQDRETMLADYDRRLKALESHDEIASWQRKIQTHQQGVREYTIAELREAQRRRLTGATSWSMNSAPNEYWILFRDLETIFAPPGLQHRTVRPLIDLGGFEPHGELRARLRLGINKAESTKDWLERVTSGPTRTLEQAHEFDRQLLEEFKRPDTFRQEKRARLGVFPIISRLFRVEDMDWARQFLEFCNHDAQMGDDVKRMSADACVKAACAYAFVETRIEAISFLESLQWVTKWWHGRHELSRALRNWLPLEEWIGLHDDAANRLARLTLSLLDTVEESDRYHENEDLTWALVGILNGAKRFNRSIDPHLRETIQQAARKMLEPTDPREEPVRSATQSALTQLMYRSADNEEERNQIVERQLQRALEIPTSTSETAAHGGPFAIWISLVELGVKKTHTKMASVAGALWEQLNHNWPAHVRLARQSVDNVWPQVHFLSLWLTAAPHEHRLFIQEKLLELLELGPRHFDACSTVLDPALWGAMWVRLVALLHANAQGGPTRSPIIRCAMLKMLRAWGDGGEEPKVLPDDIDFLVDVATWAITDESEIVANNGASALVSYARHLKTPRDLIRLGQAISRAAKDPRVLVRFMIAYGVKQIAETPRVPDDLRQLARQLDEKLARDPYALVQRQRLYGELDAKPRFIAPNF